MSYCFAIRTTDASLLSAALSPFEKALTVSGAPQGWGLGYYQSDQPLLRKQPRPSDDELSFAQQSSKLRSHLLLGHRREEPRSQGAPTTVNTHPFRLRNWIFCHCGNIENFDEIKGDVLRAIPDFIRRNIRGSTDSEHLFHLYLAFLNDTGKLNDHRISGEVAGRALASTLTYVERLSGRPSNHVCLVTNGELLVATHRGLPLALTRHSAYRGIRLTPDEDPLDYPHLRTVLLMGGQAAPDEPGWETVAENTVVTVDSELNIEYTTPSEE